MSDYRENAAAWMLLNDLGADQGEDGWDLSARFRTNLAERSGVFIVDAYTYRLKNSGDRWSAGLYQSHCRREGRPFVLLVVSSEYAEIRVEAAHYLSAAAMGMLNKLMAGRHGGPARVHTSRWKVSLSEAARLARAAFLIASAEEPPPEPERY